MRGVIEGKGAGAGIDPALVRLYLAAAELRVDPERAVDAAKEAAAAGADAELCDGYRALARAAADGRRLSASEGGAAVAAKAIALLGDRAAAAILASADPAAPGDPALEAAVDALGWSDAEVASKVAGEGTLGGWITLRHAALLFHARSFDVARAALSDFLRRFPAHPGAARARDLLGRLDARETVDLRKVGVLLPLSGKYASFGAAARTGIEIAFDGSDVTLVFKDTAGEDAKARALTEELILKDKVAAILGPVGTKESAAAAAKAEEYGVPLLTLTYDEEITALGSWVFRLRGSNAEQARAVAHAAVARYGLKTFGVLYPIDEYGTEMMRAFWDEVVKNGGEVTAVEGYLPGSVDLAGEVNKLVGRHYLEARTRDLGKIRKDLREKGGFAAGAYGHSKLEEAVIKELEPVVDFEGLFIPDYAEELKYVLPYLNAADIEFLNRPDREAATLKKKHHDTVPTLVTLLGGAGWTSSPKLFTDPATKDLKAIASNAIFGDTYFDGASWPEAGAFASAYEGRTHKRPPALAAQAHDAGLALAEALRRAGAKAGRTELRAALAGLRDLAGACGKLTMLPNRAVTRDLVLLTVDDDGKIVTRDAYEAARTTAASAAPAKGAPRPGAAKP
jgi:ABC-type branched-subunit amino acid transport system substrate-binding protein